MTLAMLAALATPRGGVRFCGHHHVDVDGLAILAALAVPPAQKRFSATRPKYENNIIISVSYIYIDMESDIDDLRQQPWYFWYPAAPAFFRTWARGPAKPAKIAKAQDRTEHGSTALLKLRFVPAHR